MISLYLKFCGAMLIGNMVNKVLFRVRRFREEEEDAELASRSELALAWPHFVRKLTLVICYRLRLKTYWIGFVITLLKKNIYYYIKSRLCKITNKVMIKTSLA